MIPILRTATDTHRDGGRQIERERDGGRQIEREREIQPEIQPQLKFKELLEDAAGGHIITTSKGC